MHELDLIEDLMKTLDCFQEVVDWQKETLEEIYRCYPAMYCECINRKKGARLLHKLQKSRRETQELINEKKYQMEQDIKRQLRNKRRGKDGNTNKKKKKI